MEKGSLRSWIGRLFGRGAPSEDGRSPRHGLEGDNLRLKARLASRQNALRAAEARTADLERRLAERTAEVHSLRRRLGRDADQGASQT